MGKGISVIVGRAESGDGPEIPVYRALRDLLCSSCCATIGEGMLFTRRELGAGGPRVAAQCPRCVPFKPPPDEGKGGRRSPLLESLLTPEPVGDDVTERHQVGFKAEAVRKRLGPALRYRAGKRGTGR